MMDKKTLIAIVLSIAILVMYQMFFTEPPTPPAQKAKEAPAPMSKPTEPPLPSPSTAEKSAVTGATAENTVKIDTDLYTATLSSRGGTLKSFQLKKYKDKDSLSIVLLKDRGAYPALGIGQKGDFSLSNQDFVLTGKDLRLSVGSPSGTVIFEYTGPQVSIKRTYTFHNESYRFDLKDEVKGITEYELALSSDFGISRRDESVHAGPVLLMDADRIELTAKGLRKEAKAYTGNLKWIAQEDKYFFSAIVPGQKMLGARAWAFEDSEVISFKAESGVLNFMVYAGPKDHESLKQLGVGLEHIIDFGFFSIIARPLFWSLKFINRFVGNYGWAIVFLTIVVRIPFIPIVNISQRAMKKLQDVQPRIQEIREKHKKDPQRMQKEMMELYKKYKVNPMSGCIPILLQIPVFFALYKVLLIAIELRSAPFMLWITDLSHKDPYYILPIVMGATMVIQQKMTPFTGDPRQQKLMMFMPVIFTLMFLNFASGLVLYWLVNNILSIAQQYYINKKAKQPAPA